MISISCRKAVCTAILLLTTRPGPATPHGVTEVINADDTTYKDIITITDTPQTHSLVANKTLHFSGVANSSATTLTFVYDTTKIFTPVFSFVTPQNSPQVAVFTEQRCSGFAWNVPMEATLADRTCSYHTISRQICPLLYCETAGIVAVYVRSLAEPGVNFTMSAGLMPSLIPLNTDTTVSVATWMPRFFRVDLGIYSAVNVLVKSDDDRRAFISVQNASCPVYDLPQNIRFGGDTQTISTVGQIYVKKPEPGLDSFFVLTLPPQGTSCHTNDTSNYTITITPAMTHGDYVQPMLILLALFSAAYVLAAVWMFVGILPAVLPGASAGVATITNSGTSDSIHAEADIAQMFSNHRTSWDDGSYRGTDKFYFRSKRRLHVADLARKLPSFQSLKSMRYLWYLVVVSIFYLLPVAQLVLGYVTLFSQGDQDTCYFNFQCSQPYGRIHSINNVYSNIGYVLLGALFIVIVRSRANAEKKQVGSAFESDLGSSNEFTQSADDLGTPDSAHGLPPNQGVFYAIGYAMICEGLCSACYHVCPNARNFQFDTSFMYIIALLLILALYQRRHADIQAQPQWLYLGVGVLIALTVVGVYWGAGNTIFYVNVFLLYLALSYSVSLAVYLVAPWKFFWCQTPTSTAAFAMTSSPKSIYDGDIDTSSEQSVTNDTDRQHFLAVREKQFFAVQPFRRFLGVPPMAPYRPARLVLVVFANVLNWVLLIVAISMRTSDVPSFFLMLVILNFILYYLHYVALKFIRGEKMSWKPILCGLLSLVTWAPALHYFNAGLISWEHDAAFSREGNQPCILWDFYDAHDLWHILSSFALFFGCIMLLTLDDDLMQVPRSKIQV